MPDNGRMDPQGFSENSRLRASDADRDQAATVLNNAMAEGRLTVDEHSERLDAVYAAKTHADIVPLLDDLPGHGTALAPVSRPGALAPSGPVNRIMAILSGATRKGVWHVEPVMDIVTVLGGVELASVEYLNAMPVAVAPRLLGADTAVRVLVMEELPAGVSLAESLLQGDEVTARADLVAYIKIFSPRWDKEKAGTPITIPAEPPVTIESISAIACADLPPPPAPNVAVR